MPMMMIKISLEKHSTYVFLPSDFERSSNRIPRTFFATSSLSREE